MNSTSDIDKILKRYKIVLTEGIVKEIPINDKYFHLDDTGGFIFCRWSDNIYIISHPSKGRGWYPKSDFEHLLLSSICDGLIEKTKGIFAFGTYANFI
ncbi:MAG: hypothetical protein M0R48_08565 [Candidatus Omnitrophica bacterium]|nr:hypothetical protein [Candidatus Omnitrophota bacterium]